ncbi:FAD-dependent oxidoreductase [Sphingobacterium oryzagri]|uniref:FAD-dependent oxidoreductase n=1 Tax=Sphingobacterium oryzagri TaxID=3025669 RepID=A0ABY7WB92_9SPHI|nr:FAD-dependent oxidoreductase [Sphingobacterium sp. KACC 22765]WDF66919.1 FAD-dependent oxidoreductase [Sphingobacterium sp. KACC 22765]
MLSSFPADKDADVLVIGAGITGLTTALALLEKGKSCIVLEARSIAFGTTGGTSAHLNTVLDTPYSDIIKQHGIEKAQEVLRSTRKAMEWIRHNVEKFAIDCDLTDCSGQMYAGTADEKKQLEKIKDGIIELGISCREVSDVDIPVKQIYAIEFAEQGHFNPAKYVVGMAEAIQALGGYILGESLVQKVSRKDGNILAETQAGDLFRADHVIYATHTTPGIQLMNFRVAPYRSYLQLWQLANESEYPEKVIYDMEEPFHYFRTVIQGRQRFLLVGGQDHKTAHAQNEQANFLALDGFVQKHFSPFKKVYEWSSQYYESLDALPFIGYYPGKPDHRELIATGFGGNGMIFGSLAGHMLADLIVTGNCEFESLYSPGRFGPLSSFKDLIVENVDVLKHFVQDRLSITKIDGLAELARGEAAVLKYEGQRIGVYKDGDGAITAIDPVCKHAGCLVKWNNTEESWDCPCHGARYNIDGEVLTGPSMISLSKCEIGKR